MHPPFSGLTTTRRNMPRSSAAGSGRQLSTSTSIWQTPHWARPRQTVGQRKPARVAAAITAPPASAANRSDERRVGQECLSTCRARVSQYLKKEKDDKYLV